MTTHQTDPDFEGLRSKAPRMRGRRFLGAAPVLLGLLAGMNGVAYQQEPSPPPTIRRPPPRQQALPVNPRRMWTPPPAVTPMVVPAPTGIDEAMIHEARPAIDPKMVVPAFPAVEAVPAPLPYDPLWDVPIPPAPGFTEPGGTTPRR